MRLFTTMARLAPALLMALAGIIGAGLAATAADAAAPTCEKQIVRRPPAFLPTVECVVIKEPHPNPGGGEEGGDGGTVDPNGCHWEVYPLPPGVVPDRPGNVSAEAIMYWEICTNDLGNDYVGPGGAQWFEPGGVPIPSPQEVAATFRVEIASRLTKPTLVADPPEGTPSVMALPAFVAVSNWQGVQQAGGCDPTGTVCVDMTATPTLTFDPGEAGAAVVTCADGGTRFDPNGPPPREQAQVPGACAHVFEQRTGSDGRPDAWPGVVMISWDVRWAQRGGGESGVFPVIELSTDLPREVDEVQTVNGTP